ncbi:chy and ring finger domain-containing protein [Colletotrichum truncatum]|uniref:Chy and ring finger domain-containing protein n=1 Tax=Colletotrichum truncatum TaxID=5467 RepID=A0ACC3Z9G3_COLTU|nr:chy and ring finger domain-containing protein [Colletotrichum truncatum]KAF6793525.1 chy and ring finger domain-containing protein [Colletotrichum truncatum]
MSSLVSEFIINPVLRQARRFSEISRTTLVPEPEVPSDAVAVASDSETPASRHATHPPAESPPERPLSASTLSPTVEAEQPPSAPARAPAATFPMTVPMPPPKGESLPADDGMGALRKRLIGIQTQNIPAEDKARLMHEVLMEGYRKSRVTPQQGDSNVEALPAGEAWEQSLPIGPLESLKFWQHPLGEPSSPEKFLLTAEDVRPTYAPAKPTTREEPEGAKTLGCQHYMRNVKLQCSTCHKWYTCRFCHDAVEDHTLVRKETKNMLCMLCACPQRASEVCVNCGVTAARYYCNVCKLWDDHPSKSIYHCNDCGICRRGIGIGKDFFHCKKCCACISISIQHSHKCIERSTDCNCPICGEYMFTSPKPVVFMLCGHSIHQKCYDEHMLRSYKCPICNKSLLNMQSQFRQLELAILSQPMPPEFRDTRATVLCNDCSGRSSVPYHWLGLKCAICTSYNTVELQISGGRDGTPPTPANSVPVQLSPAAVETPTPIRGDVPSSGRRRHSSHAGPEARFVMLDRLARSASPGPTPGLPPNALHGAIEEEESENDILDLWGRGRGRHDSEDDSDYMSTDLDEEEDEYDDEDDDDDDDNDFMLIGHR